MRLSSVGEVFCVYEYVLLFWEKNETKHRSGCRPWRTCAFGLATHGVPAAALCRPTWVAGPLTMGLAFGGSVIRQTRSLGVEVWILTAENWKGTVPERVGPFAGFRANGLLPGG